MRTELPETVVKGRRLGRHINHDPRSLRYPFRAPTVQFVSRRWSTDTTPILDQGDVGSCTGNATVGALLCDNNNPLHNALTPEQISTLNEDTAVNIYSKGTSLDDYAGTYKPDDTGCDGLSVAKAAQGFGYISGYSHALGRDDALAALTLTPVIIGISWYEGFDNPTNDGGISISGSVRGGHEICLDEIDVENERVWLRNSWSRGWAVNGRAWMSWDTLGTLLSDQGDATVFSPATAPPPLPIPVPSDPGQALYEFSTSWVAHRKLYKPNEVLRGILVNWRASYTGK